MCERLIEMLHRISKYFPRTKGAQQQFILASCNGKALVPAYVESPDGSKSACCCACIAVYIFGLWIDDYIAVSTSTDHPRVEANIRK